MISLTTIGSTVLTDDEDKNLVAAKPQRRRSFLKGAVGAAATGGVVTVAAPAEALDKGLASKVPDGVSFSVLFDPEKLDSAQISRFTSVLAEAMANEAQNGLGSNLDGPGLHIRGGGGPKPHSKC